MSLAYRRAEPADLALVVASWSDSYRNSRTAGLIAMDDWQAVMDRQIRRVLERPGVTVTVAYHPGDSDHRADLYGWIAVETGYEVPRRRYVAGRAVRDMVASPDPLVHYAYVKKPYRRMGIARGLLRAAGVGERFNYTCRTSVVTALADKIPQATWMHLVARHPKHKPTKE